MAGQPVGSVHVNQLLSNLAVLYRPDQSGFIADQVCPYIGVAHESDLYPVFGQDDFYSVADDDLVPDRSEPRVIAYSHSTASYQAVRREFAWDISDRERNNADNQLRLETNKQNGTLGRLMLKREARVATLLRKTTTGQLALGASAAQKWDSASTTYLQIMTQIIIAKAAIRSVIGLQPNTIVIPAAVAEGMQKSLFFQAIQYTASRETLVSEVYPSIPPVISGMRVLIPSVIQNTAAENIAGSYSDVWGESVRVLYVTNGPDLENPSVAYTFRAEPLTTRQWRDDKRRVDGYAVGQTIDERVVASSAGYEIDDCLT
jgi:hypothetical protein